MSSVPKMANIIGTMGSRAFAEAVASVSNVCCTDTGWAEATTNTSPYNVWCIQKWWTTQALLLLELLLLHRDRVGRTNNKYTNTSFSAEITCTELYGCGSWTPLRKAQKPLTRKRYSMCRTLAGVGTSQDSYSSLVSVEFHPIKRHETCKWANISITIKNAINIWYIKS